MSERENEFCLVGRQRVVIHSAITYNAETSQSARTAPRRASSNYNSIPRNRDFLSSALYLEVLFENIVFGRENPEPAS